MTWRHAILEIYEPETGWPTDGTPSEWVSQKTVGWCDGDLDNLVALTPLWKLLWLKLNGWYHSLNDFLWSIYGNDEFNKE